MDDRTLAVVATIAAITVLFMIVFVWWLRARRHHVPIPSQDHDRPTPTLPRSAPTPSGVAVPTASSAATVPSPAPAVAAKPAASHQQTGGSHGEHKGAVHAGHKAHAKSQNDVAVAPVASPPADAPPSVPTEPDKLELIKGIGPKIVAILQSEGVTRFDQMAAWTEADIARIAPALGNFANRVARDQWVEQAKLLARNDFDAFEARFGKLDHHPHS